MRTLVIEKPGDASVVERPVPSAGPGEVVVRVHACGICGTNVHIFKGEYLGPYPVVPGHEFAGEVVEVGADVARFAIGDRVAVEPNISCGRCRYCGLGEQNFCENWQAIGVALPGAMAEWVAVPEAAVFDIGDLDFETAAFMEPLSCVLHGMSKIDVRYGETALVIGAGPIGLLLAQVARNCGAARVVAADRIASRLELAAEIAGVEPADTSGGFGPAADLVPGGYDVVIDATGIPAVIEETIGLARHGGRILLFGVAPNNAAANLKPFDIFRKGLSIHSSYTSLRNSAQALDLLRSGRIEAGKLIFSNSTSDKVCSSLGQDHT